MAFLDHAGLTHYDEKIKGYIGSKPNPNLLDNWYFANPVNQRGKTSYSSETYCIDRWKITWNSNNGAVSISSNGVQITTSGYLTLLQLIENDSNLVGKTLSISVLYGDGTLKSTQFVYAASETESGTVATAIGINTFYYGGGEIGLRFYNQTVTIVAIKLELGNHQTLAHQENGAWVLNEIPDYGEQLARCQRYFVRIGDNQQYGMPISSGLTNGTYWEGAIILPVPMRTMPVISISGKLMFYDTPYSGFINSTAALNPLAMSQNRIHVNTNTGTSLGNHMIMGTNVGSHIDFSAEP